MRYVHVFGSLTDASPNPWVYWGGYGFPWIYATGANEESLNTIQFDRITIVSYPALIGDVLLALVAVAVLTWLSTYLLRTLRRRFPRVESDVDT